jgi:hypothetical protein
VRSDNQRAAADSLTEYRSSRAPEPLGDLCQPIRSQGSAWVAGIHPGHFAVDLRLLGCPLLGDAGIAQLGKISGMMGACEFAKLTNSRVELLITADNLGPD